MSHPPAILLQLKQENEHLRNELRSLSASLDEALSKQPRKAANSSSRTLYPVREKELKVLRTRIAHSEKEVSAFREQVSASTPERTAKLEQEITEMQQLIKSKETAIRALQRRQKENGDSLDSLTNAPIVLREIQRTAEEVKVKRHKTEQLEGKLLQEEESFKTVREKILQLEAREKLYAEKLGISRRDDDEPSKPPISRSDIEEIKEKCSALEKERDSKLAEWRRHMAELESRVQAASERRSKVTGQSEARDQQVRILDSKLKELKRNVHILQRHNETLAKKGATPNLVQEQLRSSLESEGVREARETAAVA
jgi:chromosome segregation ATPase